MALPFVLVVYRLTLRFSSAVDTDALLGRLHAVAESLHQIEEEVEGRLSRGLVQVQNARDALRGHASEARGATDRLLRDGRIRAGGRAGGRRSLGPRRRLTRSALALTLSRRLARRGGAL